jgi:hypothetical protein
MISRRTSDVRGAQNLHDGINHLVRAIEMGSCSLQEEQML